MIKSFVINAISKAADEKLRSEEFLKNDPNCDVELLDVDKGFCGVLFSFKPVFFRGLKGKMRKAFITEKVIRFQVADSLSPLIEKVDYQVEVLE